MAAHGSPWAQAGRREAYRRHCGIPEDVRKAGPAAAVKRQWEQSQNPELAPERLGWCRRQLQAASWPASLRSRSWIRARLCSGFSSLLEGAVELSSCFQSCPSVSPTGSLQDPCPGLAAHGSLFPHLSTAATLGQTGWVPGPAPSCMHPPGMC